MANILEIYKQYKIINALAEHQLRVAAVAQQFCDNFTPPVDKETIIIACLLHDMGNILKFDFTTWPHLFEPEGVEYWKQVREELAQKYNSQDEHYVSLAIAKELGVSTKVLDCIDSIDFGKTIETCSRPEIEPKICDYADLRVSPQGVVSLTGRLEEGARRYKNRPDKWHADETYGEIVKACYDNEANLFKSSRIKPSDITDESIEPIVEALKSYEI